MIRRILMLVLFLSPGLLLIAQTKCEKQVTAAVETLRKAMIDADRAVLESLASAKLSYGHSSGLVQNKQEFVEAIVKGESDFVTLDLTDQTVSVSGKTAIVRHTFTSKTNDNGKPGEVRLKVLLVWKKQKGHWQLLARQAVKAPS